MARYLGVALLSLAAVFASTAMAQEGSKSKGGIDVKVEKVYRASTIKGMNVFNLEGDKIGSIDELVINVETGRVAYAALSVGGFLGVGDKLFAVPWREFRLEVDEKDKFFRLDIDKATLKDAPGFDKDAWPNEADKHWAEVEQYYKENRSDERKTSERKTTKTTTTKTTER